MDRVESHDFRATRRSGRLQLLVARDALRCLPGPVHPVSGDRVEGCHVSLRTWQVRWHEANVPARNHRSATGVVMVVCSVVFRVLTTLYYNASAQRHNGFPLAQAAFPSRATVR